MNGPQITVEEFKAVLLDLFLAQRENAMLRAQLAAQDAPQPAPDGEVTEP